MACRERSRYWPIHVFACHGLADQAAEVVAWMPDGPNDVAAVVQSSRGAVTMGLLRRAGGAKLAGWAALGALACAGGMVTPGVTQARAQATPIRHVVVIYLENHSFDNLLGFWCDNHPGRCPDGGMPALVALSNGAVVAPGTDPDTVPNVNHSVAAQAAAIDGGKMDGWQKAGGCTAATCYRCVSGVPASAGAQHQRPGARLRRQRPHVLDGRLTLLGRAHGHGGRVRRRFLRRQPDGGEGGYARARLGL